MSFWKTKNENEQSAQPVSGEVKSAPVSSATQTAPANPGQLQSEPMIAAPSPTDSPEERLTQRFGKIRSALGPGTVIQGKLSFDAVVRIDGKLSGDVFSSRPLIIGPTGQVDAQVEVSALIILGTAKGSIKATERIEAWKGAVLDAELHAPVFVVEEGATFNGECKCTRAK